MLARDPAVRLELLTAVYRQLPLTLAVALLNAVLTAVVLAPRVGQGALAAWLAATCAMVAARLAAWSRFNRLAPEARAAPHWEWIAVGGALVSGLLWGACSALLMPAEQPYPLFVAFVVAGMCAGAATVSAPHILSVIAFIVPAVLPLAVAFAMGGSRLTAVMAVMTVIFAISLIVVAARFSRFYAADVQLRTALAQRTGELATANAQGEQTLADLRVAKEAAEAADRAKSGFLALMSHELRTPLNAVIGMTGFLLEGPLEEESRHYAEMLRDAGDHLMQVINDVLDFTKLEAGQMEFEEIPFDLEGVVQGALEILAPRAHAKRIDLAAYVAPEVPRGVRGDPGRLRQVLINLVGNAVKFTESGHVVVEVGRLPSAGPEVMLSFEVHDSGIGIAAENISGLFEEFRQIDSSISRRFGGTGLGLAIARRLVEGMGGTIGVTSELGVGSVFRFTVMLAQGELPVGERETAPVRLDGARILVVDDNEPNRRILIRQIEGRGGIAEGVEGASAALEKLRTAQSSATPFVAAVIDREMPGTNGETLGTSIRADPLLCNLRLVLATSWSLDRSARQRAKGLFDAILSKPMPAESLATALLPASARRAPPVPADGPTALPVPSGAASPGPGARVLVAEDNQTNQFLMRLTLARLGYRADFVANGLEAIEAVLQRPYDIVLMDVMMPEMDGIEATRRVRAFGPPLGRIPIVGLTAYASRESQERFLSAGMDDVLTKPVDRADLALALERALNAVSART